MFYVYVIRSKSSGKLYTGQTADLDSRLKAHNLGFSPFTKNKGPWEVIYSEEYLSRSEAMNREKFLKSGKGREFLKSIITLD
jgi:putative endonuclease